jgi:membrane-anchored mycosin MYCP
VNAGDDQLAAAIGAAETADVVVVAAAGNTGAGGGSCTPNNTPGQPPVTIPLPARFDTVLAVAAVGPTDQVADFSLIGPWVDVAAPGTNIVSLDPGPGATGLVNKVAAGDSLNDINGTSFAAPYVSGVVALIRAAHPELTAAQVRDRVTSTAQHPPSADDRNDQVGFGIIDPMAAVTGLPMPPAATAQRLLPVEPAMPAPDNGPRTTALIISGTAIAAMILVAAFLVSMRRAHRLRRERLGLAAGPALERRTGHIELTGRRRAPDGRQLDPKVGAHR